MALPTSWRPACAVRHRFLFDAPARVLGFRRDGRLVVQTAQVVFALSMATPFEEPEVVSEEAHEARVEHGDVVFGAEND